MDVLFFLDKPYDIPYPEHAKTWRYMQYWKLEDLIRKNEIYFSSINKLREIEDNLEGIHSNPIQKILDERDLEYSRISSSVNPSTEVKYDWRKGHQSSADLIYVNCWHINNSESTWMWKKYAKSSESIIIQSTVHRLRSCFNDKSDYLFMGCILYIDHETFVSRPRHSLDSFMRKNLSFKNENELRIISDSGLYGNRIAHGIHKSVDVTVLIEQIVCHPLSTHHFMRKVRKLLDEHSLDVKMSRSVKP